MDLSTRRLGFAELNVQETTTGVPIVHAVLKEAPHSQTLIMGALEMQWILDTYRHFAIC